MRYQAFDPKAKIKGQAMLYFYSIAQDTTLHLIFKKYGLGIIYADQWYDMQMLLDVFNDIREEVNEYTCMSIFVNFGMKTASSTFIPPNILSEYKINSGIFHCQVARLTQFIYEKNHLGHVGSVTPKITDSNQASIIAHTPYPPDYIYGALYGIMRRFCRSFTLSYDNMSMRRSILGEEVIINMKNHWQIVSCLKN